MFCSSLNINHSKFNYNNIIIIKKNLLPLLFAIIVHAIIFATLIDNYQQPLIVNLQKIQVNFAQNTQINNRKLDTNNAIKQKEANNFVDKKNIQHLANNPNLEVIRHDIINPYIAEVDAIYHLACPASPVHYQRFPVQTIKTSVLGSINMLDLALRLRIPILLSSTSEVYGDPTISPQYEEYWGNVNPIGKRSCYDEAKRYSTKH